jgi:hypothetical protein
MNKFSKDLIERMTEACEHADSKPGGVPVQVDNVRAIRRGLSVSQMESVRAYPREAELAGQLNGARS